jgi:DNA polymerase II small subunit/DNA polymerase delta subunit B
MLAERKEALVYNHGSEDRLNQLVHEKLDHAVQNRKWTEAEDLQPDAYDLTAHVKETRARVDQAMNTLKESTNCCLNMSDNAKDWKSCAIWEGIYSACRKILHVHLESLKKEVKDDEERKRSTDIASSRRIKLQDLFLLWVYSQRMSAASLLFPLWRGSLVQLSRASDIASSRRIKLQDAFFLGDYF